MFVQSQFNLEEGSNWIFDVIGNKCSVTFLLKRISFVKCVCNTYLKTDLILLEGTSKMRKGQKICQYLVAIQYLGQKYFFFFLILFFFFFFFEKKPTFIRLNVISPIPSTFKSKSNLVYSTKYKYIMGIGGMAIAI